MTELPECVKEFSRYMLVIKGRSARTVAQYEIDIMLFLKYITAQRQGIPLVGEDFDRVVINSFDADDLKSVTKSDIMGFLAFLANDRENNSRSRARKLSALRSFFKYYSATVMVMKSNPADNIDSPKLPKSLPRHLTESESVDLLESVLADEKGKNRERDFAIITLFLNCGMRLSELASINISDIDPHLESLRITGKGAKERIVYLNKACREALASYLKVREKHPYPGHENALFLSGRHKRISIKTIQWTVKKYLGAAGLGYKHFSTHKLRHTAATLMYQTGKVDIRVLKDILGHEQLNTTQIYTHVSSREMANAMDKNPLAGIKKKDLEKDTKKHEQ